MKHLLLLVTVPLALASCAPFQLAGVNKAGKPWAMQSGGVGHKAKGVVQKAENGPIKLEQIIEEPDGTEIARGVVDMKTTLGLGGLLKDERVSADNNATKVKLGEQDVQKNKDLLDAQGAATGQAIDAGAEVAPVTTTAPGS